MSVSTDDLLEYARQHIDTEDETVFRSAISRAYYAMYHRSLASAAPCPEPPPKMEEWGNPKYEGIHRRLARRYSEVPRKGFLGARYAREIGSLLGRAHSCRVDADYHIDEPINQHTLQLVIRMAEKLMREADAFDHEYESIAG